jgi:hypothetical protein
MQQATLADRDLSLPGVRLPRILRRLTVSRSPAAAEHLRPRHLRLERASLPVLAYGSHRLSHRGRHPTSSTTSRCYSAKMQTEGCGEAVGPFASIRRIRRRVRGGLFFRLRLSFSMLAPGGASSVSQIAPYLARPAARHRLGAGDLNLRARTLPRAPPALCRRHLQHVDAQMPRLPSPGIQRPCVPRRAAVRRQLAGVEPGNGGLGVSQGSEARARGLLLGGRHLRRDIRPSRSGALGSPVIPARSVARTRLASLRAGMSHSAASPRLVTWRV